MIHRPGHPAVQRARRAFTLIEAIAAIVVLAILVPPSVVVLGDATRHRSDALDVTRATWLANAVIEQVMADVSSPSAGMGMSALGNTTTYVETPTTGLRARLTGVSSGYPSKFNWSLTIGSLVSDTGTATGDTAQDVYRYVQAVVTWTNQRGSRSLTLESLMTDLRPG